MIVASMSICVHSQGKISSLLTSVYGTINLDVILFTPRENIQHMPGCESQSALGICMTVNFPYPSKFVMVGECILSGTTQSLVYQIQHKFKHWPKVSAVFCLVVAQQICVMSLNCCSNIVAILSEVVSNVAGNGALCVRALTLHKDQGALSICQT